MTLVEITIVMALVGISALVLSQMASVSVRSQTNVRMNAEFQSAVALASQMLQNPQTCTDNFAGVTFNGDATGLPTLVVPFTRIRGRTVAGVPGPLLLEVGKAISPNLVLTRLQMQSFQVLNVGVNYWAEVSIEATKSESFSFGGRTLQASFFVPIRTSGPIGTLAIDACGLRTPPAPISMVGCYHTIIGNVWHSPCSTLNVDGFSFEDAGVREDLNIACLPIGRTVGMMLCKAK